MLMMNYLILSSLIVPETNSIGYTIKYTLREPHSFTHAKFLGNDSTRLIFFINNKKTILKGWFFISLERVMGIEPT